MAKYVPGSSVKYGTGTYDSQAHKGVGKEQKQLGPTAGEKSDSSTMHSSTAIVRDGIEGKGSPKRGYQTDAHTGLHHGPSGQAVGHLDDIRPMKYDKELQSEGDGHFAGHLDGMAPRGRSAKAEHHPSMGGENHKFKYSAPSETHGYGHRGEQVSGVLRLSGHSKAHQVGKRKR